MISLSLTDDQFHALHLAAEVNYPIQYSFADPPAYDSLLADHAALISEYRNRNWRPAQSLILEPHDLHEARQASVRLYRGTVRLRADLLRSLLMDYSALLNYLHGEWDLTGPSGHVITPFTEETITPLEEDTMAKEKAPKKEKKAKTAKPKAEGGNIAANYEYTKTKVKTADGKSKTVVDNADRVAAVMRGSDEKALRGIAKENGIAWDPSSYKNPGLARMALGNKLRGMVRNPEVKVTIDGKAIASL